MNLSSRSLKTTYHNRQKVALRSRAFKTIKATVELLQISHHRFLIHLADSLINLINFNARILNARSSPKTRNLLFFAVQRAANCVFWQFYLSVRLHGRQFSV